MLLKVRGQFETQTTFCVESDISLMFCLTYVAEINMIRNYPCTKRQCLMFLFVLKSYDFMWENHDKIVIVTLLQKIMM